MVFQWLRLHAPLQQGKVPKILCAVDPGQKKKKKIMGVTVVCGLPKDHSA